MSSPFLEALVLSAGKDPLPTPGDNLAILFLTPVRMLFPMLTSPCLRSSSEAAIPIPTLGAVLALPGSLLLQRKFLSQSFASFLEVGLERLDREEDGQKINSHPCLDVK